MANKTIEQDLADVREQFRQCSYPLFVLGDIVRQDILILLSEHLDTGMNVTEITANIELSRPAVSHHLKVLKDAGFITPVKKGTHVFYFIDMHEPFAKLKELVVSLDTIAERIKAQTCKKGCGDAAGGGAT